MRTKLQLLKASAVNLQIFESADDFPILNLAEILLKLRLGLNSISYPEQNPLLSQLTVTEFPLVLLAKRPVIGAGVTYTFTRSWEL